MGTYPLFDRPTPLADLLKERPTLILEKPLMVMLNSGLPAKGTGLKLGTAGPRRGGTPRTLRERLQRHPTMFGK